MVIGTKIHVVKNYQPFESRNLANSNFTLKFIYFLFSQLNSFVSQDIFWLKVEGLPSFYFKDVDDFASTSLLKEYGTVDRVIWCDDTRTEAFVGMRGGLICLSVCVCACLRARVCLCACVHACMRARACCRSHSYMNVT